MIDTCLNDSRLTDCSGEKVAPWGTLYPVYDRASDLNFYNHLCAECNGAYNYLFWDLNLEAFTYERSLTTCLNAMSEGRHSDCRIGFTPPKEMNEIDHVCSLGLVSSCNVTGRWLQYDADLEQACASMFSPVLNKAGLPEFANVYCALCNGVSVPDDVCFGTTNTSDVLPPLPPIELGSQKALSMLLEYETVSSVINSPPISGTTVPNNGKCGKLMVKHPTKVI